MNKFLLIPGLFILSLILSCNNPGKNVIQGNDQPVKNQPIQVIFDTDLGNDIDDVLALQMVLNYHKQGKINLLGITLSKANPLAVKFVDGYCNFNNLPEVPIGYVYDGVNPEEGTYLRQTLETKVDGHNILVPKLTSHDSIPEAFLLIRELLSSQIDSSVVIIAVGPQTNLARLLGSGPDNFSPMTGTELVANKVKLLSVMGGLYVEQYDFAEWNILQDLASAKKVFKEWPTRIIASGFEVGNALLYPHQSIEEDFSNPEKHPLCVAYNEWGDMPYDRPTWDLTSVLVAIEAEKSFFQYSPNGKIEILDDGKSRFEASEHGVHQYLIHESIKTEEVLYALRNIVAWK